MRERPVDERRGQKHQKEKTRRLVVEIEREADHEDHHLRLAFLEQRVDGQEEYEEEPEETRGEKKGSLGVVEKHVADVSECLAYSVGVADEWDFEKALKAIYKEFVK